MRLIIGLIIGLVIGLSLSSAIALMTKYESQSLDAKSVVLYGYNGTTLVPINVMADGTLIVQ